MTNSALFLIRESSQQDMVTISFEGRILRVPAGISVAAALLSNGVYDFRSSVVGQAPRAPYCMMGACFECLVEINEFPSRQSCLIAVQNGMQVRRQIGASAISIQDEL